MGFMDYFSLSCLAALLLTTGGGHLSRFRAFRALLGEHDIIPAPFVPLAALSIPVIEMTSGAVALLLLAGNLQPFVAPSLFAAGAVVGTIFLFYVRQLLRRSTDSTSCGCSPLSSPLTPASMLPAATLILTSGVGFLSAVWSDVNRASALDSPYGLIVSALPIFAGVVFAGITILVPASMPLPTIDTRESQI